ncbi:MAG: hypothetical protein LC679_12740 [Intrasporangiaceae bacterium]|nr:hypothetical protein [Intrasporangiaceae bacterium]
MSASHPAPERPPLRLVRGDATPEEIAAIIAVLAAASGGDSAAGGGGRRPSRWAAPASRIRPPVLHGPGAWRSSALPH